MHHIARSARSVPRLATASRVTPTRPIHASSLLKVDYQNKDERKTGHEHRRSPAPSSGPKAATHLSTKPDSDVHSAPNKDFQPGQTGEQVGGQLNGVAGKERGSAGHVGEQERARDENSVTDKVKGVLGIGGRGFATYARARKDAESKARETKDDDVQGAQTPHLKHVKPGQGDEMPAIKNNAALPSKQDGSAGAGRHEASTHPGRTGAHEPSWESKAEESHTLANDGKPKAEYTHIRGKPEPSSDKANYEYVRPESEVTPSGAAPHSSTSTSPPHPHTTQKDGHPTNAAGVGSSNRIHRLEDADPSKGETETGHGGRPYTVPSDFRAAKDDLGGLNPRARREEHGAKDQGAQYTKHETKTIEESDGRK